MSTHRPQNTKEKLEQLALHIRELTTVCEQLREENTQLRNLQITLTEERAALLERTEMARARVEAMISRLKAMESTS